MDRVFISHVAEDAALAVRLAAGLEQAGFTTWYYERDSLPGPSYLDQILAALDRCAAVVALVSPAALASWQVDKEIVQAHERGLSFVPLLHGLGYEEMRARRPAWAMAFGGAVALPLPSEDVGLVLPQVVAGLRWLAGARPDGVAHTTAGTATPDAATGEPATGIVALDAPATGTAAQDIREASTVVTHASPFDALPVPPTALLGRAQALALLAALVAQPEVRLLTLTGPGGVGKTRLALALAQQARAAFADGVCFVDLAPVSDPALVLPTIAAALGVREAGGQPLAETLRAALAERALLLLLDNCEQVLDAAPEVAALLAGCPHLMVLATSRVPLRLRGEQEIAVPPLAVPDPDRLPVLESLAQVPAVALFVARARDARADFALDAANAAAVAAICRRLDGLPLAIELAAARVKLLPPAALLTRLDKRLGLLVGGARDLPERQRTLRATIDWSYGLLPPQEQTLFARLGVFQSGRTLEAVEAVCNPDGTLDVLTGVEALLANSLLTQVEAEGETRFTMLETLHEYARERLDERGETAALRQAHALYYLALAEEAAPQLMGAQQAAWLARLEREHDNLRVALHWAVASARDAGSPAALSGAAALGRSGDQATGALSVEPETAEIGLRLAGVLWRFWYRRAHFSEGRRWLEAVLEASAAGPAAARALALGGAGALAQGQGDDARATELTEQALSLYRALGDTRGIANALNTLAVLAHDRGDYGRATAYYEEALSLHRTLGHTRGMAMSLNNLGNAAHDQGDDARAAPLLEEALALYQDLGDVHSVAGVLNNLGLVASARGDWERAGAVFARSLTLCRTVGDRWLGAYDLEGLAGVAAAGGQPVRAARLYGAAAATRRAIDAPVPPNERPAYERQVEAVRAALDVAAFAAAWAAGESLPWEQAIAEALGEPATPHQTEAGAEPSPDGPPT